MQRSPREIPAGLEPRIHARETAQARRERYGGKSRGQAARGGPAIEPRLKVIDGGLRQLIRGVARPHSPEGGRPDQPTIARAIGETLEELSRYCPEAHHIKRIKVKRDAPRGEGLRGWRYHVTVIFERDPTARTEGDET